MNGNQLNDLDLSVDKQNLYREESMTDLKVASIRQLIPIKTDGSVDPERKPVFIGHTQLMSPDGPLPVQAHLEADSFEQALEKFPAIMKQAISEMIDELKKWQQEQQQQGKGDDSRIIIPRM